MVFIQDNGPSHAGHLTTSFFKEVLVKKGEIMEWPACSPDVNSIENLWSILKREMYAGGKQYSSKEEVWNAITTTAKLKVFHQIQLRRCYFRWCQIMDNILNINE